MCRNHCRVVHMPPSTLRHQIFCKFYLVNPSEVWFLYKVRPGRPRVPAQPPPRRRYGYIRPLPVNRPGGPTSREHHDHHRSSPQDVQALDDSVVVGNDGSEIGKVGQVYTDNDTGQPSWVTVKTGWFGTNESFVPLSSATVEGDTIRVPYDKDMIKGAPNNDAGEPLSETDEQEPVLLLRFRRDQRTGHRHRYRDPRAGRQCRFG